MKAAWLKEVLTHLKSLWQDDKKRPGLLLVAGIAGMVLLALSEWLPAPKTDAQTEQAEAGPTLSASAQTAAYAAELEQRLQRLLGQVEGVGKAEVMVTLCAGEGTVYAKDSQLAADGSEQYSHVLLQGTGTDPALIETVTPPAVQGVAVVCQGGGNAAVQSRVTQIVQALTGAGSSHITVARMGTPEQ